MNFKTLGNTKINISEMGLGCMGMSEFYGSTDEQESIATLHRALDLGLNFFDTADMYGNGTNELLLARAFKDIKNKVIIATKFGIIRSTNPMSRSINGNPEYVKQACEASLKRLGIDTIDLYYLHRLDPETPIEETIGAMANLVKEGKVKHIGLSEVSAKTLQRAYKVHPISALQSEYSLWTRDPEKELIPLCERLKISFVAYSPLGRGFLTSKITSPKDLEENDFRSVTPRFSGKNFDHNYQLVEALTDIANVKQCTAAQLALAWMMSKYSHVIPIPGTKRRKYLDENIAATKIILTRAEITKIDHIFSPDKISGARYHEIGMKSIDV